MIIISSDRMEKEKRWHMKKKAIVFLLTHNDWNELESYYIRNILFCMLQNEMITSQYAIVVVSDQNQHEFDFPFEGVKVYRVVKEHSHELFLILGKLRLRYRKLIMMKRYDQTVDSIFCRHTVCYIPEFRQETFPDQYSMNDKIVRKKRIRSLVKKKEPIVVNSNSAKNDLNRYYGEARRNVAVLHYVSYLEDILQSMRIGFEKTTLEKYGLVKEQYVYYPGAYSAYKNQKEFLDMMSDSYNKENERHLPVVFSCLSMDERQREYMNELKEYVVSACIENQVIFLEKISYLEQIAIMKHARCLIQMSVYEAWNEIVEDGKVLGKQMVLSDISVHREQMNEQCHLVELGDHEALHKLVCEAEVTADKVGRYDSNKETKRMARGYSIDMEQMLSMLG